MGETPHDASPLAARALDFIPDGAVVGLGTGRAAEALLRALADRVRAGFRVRGVPTSVATEHLARSLGVTLLPFEGVDAIDIAIDGADEAAPNGDLIKGYGGALLREKAVARRARRLLILIGEEKLVPVLGRRGRLPVEVVPAAAAEAVRAIAASGYRADLRMGAAAPAVTDGGHWLLDLAVGDLSDPAGLDAALGAVPGVVGTGLFLGFRPALLIRSGPAVRLLTPP